MPTWNPVIIASGREKVLKTAFGRNINLAKKKKEEEEGGRVGGGQTLQSHMNKREQLRCPQGTSKRTGTG